MREIKFRGKDVETCKWVYGYYTGFNDVRNCSYITKMGAYGARHKVRPESVGQFTGLKDKNGKEVYEGDITTCWYEDFCWEVYWDEQRWWLRNKTKERYYGDRNCCDDQETHIKIDKVIGNTTDNHELLGGITWTTKQVTE